MSTTTKTSARVMETDPKTGRKYVKTQTVEGAAVTVTKFSGEEVGGVLPLDQRAVRRDRSRRGGVRLLDQVGRQGVQVGAKPAASLSKAVRAVLGTEQLAAPKKDAKPSTRTRKSAATRRAGDAAQAGGSVIEADPDTGLPRIKPNVQAKADAVVADQLAAKRAAKDAG